MRLAPLAGKFHLLLAFAKALFTLGAHCIAAVRTGYAGLKQRRGFVGFGNRMATGVTLVVMPLIELMIHGNPVIKYKALALQH